MKRFFFNHKFLSTNLLILSFFLTISLLGNRTVTVLSQKMVNRKCVILDAGHGGVDGGAVSCTGVPESQINLQIALRLNDLMHLLGIKTKMIRNTDCSVYTDGNTIAAKKISDIKERVHIVNTTPHAVFISIHQNHFHDPQYCGAQVFYNDQDGSKLLAENLQTALKKNLQPTNRRQCKRSTGVYLMEHINCTGILLECGFLSNASEEALLLDETYQKRLCAVVACGISEYLNT